MRKNVMYPRCIRSFSSKLRGYGVDDEVFDGFEDGVGVLVRIDHLRLRERVTQLLRKCVVALQTIFDVRFAVILPNLRKKRVGRGMKIAT